MIAKFIIDGKKIARLSFFPCVINEQRQPELLKNDKRGQLIFDYMDKITEAADLNTWYEWEGNEIVVHPK